MKQRVLEVREAYGPIHVPPSCSYTIDGFTVYKETVNADYVVPCKIEVFPEDTQPLLSLDTVKAPFIFQGFVSKKLPRRKKGIFKVAQNDQDIIDGFLDGDHPCAYKITITIG